MNNFAEFIPIQKVFFTFVIIFSTFLISIIIRKIIDITFSKMQERAPSPKLIAKTKTIRTLLHNVVDAILFIMMILMIMSNWGINITPLLTGAGILGLGVSFGSQSLVKDIISGFFIIFEDQFNVGDRVKIGDFEGEVLKITLRLTVLKDKSGNKVFIPNSKIETLLRYKPA
jgi:moderate conductance mechanosensitive channel